MIAMQNKPPRLATYGTLAPGRANAGQLAKLKGNWQPGQVRGHLLEAGWGAEQGYPGLRLDPEGALVDVMVFTSDDLPAHWDRLDAFEGPGYRRVLTIVQTQAGPLQAEIYELAPG